MIDLDNLNPDCMDEADLRKLGANLKTLSRYCTQKARGMSWRKRGHIKEALIAEQALEKLHQELPPDWRW